MQNEKQFRNCSCFWHKVYTCAIKEFYTKIPLQTYTTIIRFQNKSKEYILASELTYIQLFTSP